MPRPIVILDRDGTITVERHHLCDTEGVELLPGAAGAMQEIRAMGLPIVVATNQSVVGRGMLSVEGLDAIHDRLRDLLAQGGASADAIYVCPHRPEEECGCRKPRPGLARRAQADFDADLRSSFVVGDKACDIGLGRAIGATTIWVRTGHGHSDQWDAGAPPDFVIEGLGQAPAIIREVVSQRWPGQQGDPRQ